MGRNVQYFCERFGACSLDVIDSSKQWKLMADEGIVSRAGMIQELVIVSDGLLCMSTDDFTHNVVLALIEHSSFLNNFIHAKNASNCKKDNTSNTILKLEK